MISVIIPVFNAEKTLMKCVQSILNQTYRDFEIIIVNDGSTDSSEVLCQKIACDNKCVRIFTTENGGVSKARNIGIQNAWGDYLTFVDADDYIDSDYLERYMQIIHKTDADIVLGGVVIGDSEKCMSVDSSVSANILQGKKIEELTCSILDNKIYGNMVYVPQSVGFSCGKIYQKDALSGLSFPEGIPIREDAIFNIQAFMAAKKIVVTNLRGYHYIINGQSATGRFRFNYTSEAKTFLNKCLQLWDDYNLPINSYHIGVLYTYMSWLKMYALNANAPFTKQQKIQLLQESFEDEVYSDSFNRVAKNTLNYQYKLLRLLFVNKSTAGIQTMFLLYKVKGKMK